MWCLILLACFATSSQAAYRDLVLDEGPILYYEFTEVTGTTAVDSSGNGFDGTYTGGTIDLTAAGAHGTGVGFPGGDNFVDVPDLGICSAEYTIEFIIVAFDGVGTGECCTSIYHTDAYPGDNTGDGGALHVVVFDDGFMEVDAPGAGFAEGGLPGGIGEVPITHIAITFVAGEPGAIYIDGVPGDPFTATEPGTCFTDSQIGAWAGEVAGRNFIGILDEFAIYDFALAPETIAAHAAQKVPPTVIFDPSNLGTLTESTVNNSTTFTVTLAQGSPEAGVNVEITLDPNDGTNDGTDIDLGLGAGTPITLTFTTSNWDTPQTVTASAVDDSLFESCIEASNIASSAVPSDPNSAYNNYNNPSVNVSVLDNNTGCVIVDPTDVSVEELDPNNPEQQAVYSYVLNRAPIGGSLVITATPDASVVEIDPSTLTFDNLNWGTPQEVTVKAIPDDELLDDGALVDTIISSATHSEIDPNNFSTISNVNVNITQDECGQLPFIEKDFNQDCFVNLLDFSIFSGSWADCTEPLIANCP